MGSVGTQWLLERHPKQLQRIMQNFLLHLVPYCLLAPLFVFLGYSFIHGEKKLS
jgi:hypothetical protein